MIHSKASNPSEQNTLLKAFAFQLVSSVLMHATLRQPNCNIFTMMLVYAACCFCQRMCLCVEVVILHFPIDQAKTPNQFKNILVLLTYFSSAPYCVCVLYAILGFKSFQLSKTSREKTPANMAAVEMKSQPSKLVVCNTGWPQTSCRVWVSIFLLQPQHIQTQQENKHKNIPCVFDYFK